MNTLRYRPISAVLGINCIIVGSLAALNGGGTVAATAALGHTLVIAGAIIVAAVIISAAIVESSRWGIRRE